MAAGLYPAGTEFLNTLRYVAVSDSGNIRDGTTHERDPLCPETQMADLCRA